MRPAFRLLVLDHLEVARRFLHGGFPQCGHSSGQRSRSPSALGLNSRMVKASLHLLQMSWWSSYTRILQSEGLAQSLD